MSIPRKSQRIRTYVIGGVQSWESIHRSNKPDKKGQSAGAPITSIIKCTKDLFR